MQIYFNLSLIAVDYNLNGILSKKFGCQKMFSNNCRFNGT